MSLKVIFIFVLLQHFTNASWEKYSNTASVNLRIEKEGILAGVDGSGNNVYVGKSLYLGVSYPGYLINRSGIRSFFYSVTRAFTVTSGFEFYAKDINCEYRWVASSNGAVVANAVEIQAGWNVMYIARYQRDGATVVGRVTRGYMQRFFYAFSNAEYSSSSNYEVLVRIVLPATRASTTTTTKAPTTTTTTTTTTKAPTTTTTTTTKPTTTTTKSDQSATIAELIRRIYVFERNEDDLRRRLLITEAELTKTRTELSVCRVRCRVFPIIGGRGSKEGSSKEGTKKSSKEKKNSRESFLGNVIGGILNGGRGSREKNSKEKNSKEKNSKEKNSKEKKSKEKNSKEKSRGGLIGTVGNVIGGILNGGRGSNENSSKGRNSGEGLVGRVGDVIDTVLGRNSNESK